MKTMRRGFVLYVFVGFLSFTGSQVHGTTKDIIDYTIKNEQFLKIIGCLLQVPGIMTADSENSTTIKVATALALLEIDGKFFYELLKKRETRLLKACVYDIPKTTAYGLASIYDYLRLKNLAPVLENNDKAKSRLKIFKITQMMLLIIEGILRLLVYLDGPAECSKGKMNMNSCLNELADWIELWRLFARYTMISDQLPTVSQSLDQKTEDLKTKLAVLLEKTRQV